MPYYTPTIDEFHVGFEYEVKSTFTDGTVKTQQDFEDNEWVKKISDVGDSPYIERALTGRNAENGICGIRVKYLDQQDVESLGWVNTADNKFILKDTLDTTLEFATNEHGIWILIKDDGYQHFSGKIKNKSELIKIMFLLGV